MNVKNREREKRREEKRKKHWSAEISTLQTLGESSQSGLKSRGRSQGRLLLLAYRQTPAKRHSRRNQKSECARHVCTHFQDVGTVFHPNNEYLPSGTCDTRSERNYAPQLKLQESRTPLLGISNVTLPSEGA